MSPWEWMGRSTNFIHSEHGLLLAGELVEGQRVWTRILTEAAWGIWGQEPEAVSSPHIWGHFGELRKGL